LASLCAADGAGVAYHDERAAWRFEHGSIVARYRLQAQDLVVLVRQIPSVSFPQGNSLKTGSPFLERYHAEPQSQFPISTIGG
jgi:hypothetical protein